MKKFLLSILILGLLSTAAFAGADRTFSYTANDVVSSEACIGIPFWNNRQLTGTYLTFDTDLTTEALDMLTIASTTDAKHTLSAAAAAGQTIVTVSSGTGLAVGNWVYLRDKDDFDEVEVNKIAEISGGTITLEANLIYGYTTYDNLYEMQSNQIFPDVSSGIEYHSNAKCLWAEARGLPIGFKIGVTSAGQISTAGYYNN